MNYKVINAALVTMHKAGCSASANKLYKLNIGAIGKKYNRIYPSDWLDAQAYIIMRRCLDRYDPNKGTAFVTYWINWCRYKLPHMWDAETHLIYYPSHPEHKRCEVIVGDEELYGYFEEEDNENVNTP